MAELLLKVGNSERYKEGDIICAFNDRRISAVHAEHICHTDKLSLNSDGLNPIGISSKFLELVHQYKFERSLDSVIRTNLKTGVIDIITSSPNASGEYVYVDTYLKRRLANNKHKIFGSKNSEYWFGGKIDVSETAINSVWQMIEQDTGKLKASYALWPLTDIEKAHHMAVKVENYTDDEADNLVRSEYDKDENIISIRKNKIDINSFPEISSDTILKHKNKNTIVDNRGKSLPISFKNKVIDKWL